MIRVTPINASTAVHNKSPLGEVLLPPCTHMLYILTSELHLLKHFNHGVPMIGRTNQWLYFNFWRNSCTFRASHSLTLPWASMQNWLSWAFSSISVLVLVLMGARSALSYCGNNTCAASSSIPSILFSPLFGTVESSSGFVQRQIAPPFAVRKFERRKNTIICKNWEKEIAG